MAHTARDLDPRIAGLPIHDMYTLGVDVGCTFTKIAMAEANGRRAGECRQLRTSAFVGVGVTEAIIQLMQDFPWRVKVGGLTAAGKQDDDGTIVPTNVPGLGRIDPVEIAKVTGVTFTLCNDVVAFVLGTVDTSDFEVLKPASGHVSRSKKSPVRSGLFLTSGTNSARARFVPVLDVWVPCAAETGWVALQPEHGNLMEQYFLECMGRPQGEVGAELWVSLGSGILNWHGVLSNAPDKVLEYYADQAVDMGRLRPHVLRPSNEITMALQGVSDEDAGPIFSRFALDGDPYAEMVMSAVCAAQGAYCRAVALMDVPDPSEGLWINSPLLADPDSRNWVLTRTRFLDRFVGRNAVGNGRRFVDYLESLPIYAVTDRYVVPAGAAANVGVQRVLDDEVVGLGYGRMS